MAADCLTYSDEDVVDCAWKWGANSEDSCCYSFLCFLWWLDGLDRCCYGTYYWLWCCYWLFELYLELDAVDVNLGYVLLYAVYLHIVRSSFDFIIVFFHY